MLTSLNPLTCLDKLTVTSLDTIGERVRLALLHVFLPRLCESCRPGFSEAFRVTQSTPALLKCLCDSCKINYVRDKRAVTRRKTPSTSNASQQAKKPVTSEDFCNPQENPTSPSSASTKQNGAKKKSRSQATDLETSGNPQIHLPKPKKVKLLTLSATSSNDSTVFAETLPISPPPEAEPPVKIEKPTKTEKVKPVLDQSRQIYEQLDEHGVDWCRYCGAAGETGTFWKLGPWGERSLCHKHGCEFFGCGFARATITRLDLTAFYRESRASRTRPIVQDFCCVCWERIEMSIEEGYRQCHGCPLSFHASCLKEEFHSDDRGNWYCSPACEANFSACLIKPQFSGKARFPFYSSVPQVDVEAIRTGSDIAPKISLRLLVPPPPLTPPVIKKTTRKYRKHNTDVTAPDRVVAFVPVKVDRSVHNHENISTPIWVERTPEESAALYASLVEDYDEVEEELDDAILLQRHARYEHVEKTTRLLKPGILESLINGGEI